MFTGQDFLLLPRKNTLSNQKFILDRHITTTTLLAARPMLDRRSSHTGIITGYGAQGGSNRRSSHVPAGPRPGTSSPGNHLNVPHARSRGSSLPGNFDAVNHVSFFQHSLLITASKVRRDESS